MKIKRGRQRVVIIIPRLGFVVKFPRVYMKRALGIAQKWGWKKFLYDFKFSTQSMGSPRYFLFGGIVANWQEFMFFLKTRHPFLQPTYFSLLGIVNIQRYGRPCDNFVEIINLFDSISREIVYQDLHCFTSPENFCLDEQGRVRMVDYSQKKTQQVIRRWGDEIWEALNKLKGS